MLVNLNDVLYDARAKKYAVGLFNATDSDMLQATVEAAEEMSSPIIIGTA
jgi:fructose-bisphosphate aldolase class II